MRTVNGAIYISKLNIPSMIQLPFLGGDSSLPTHLRFSYVSTQTFFLELRRRALSDLSFTVTLKKASLFFL